MHNALDGCRLNPEHTMRTVIPPSKDDKAVMLPQPGARTAHCIGSIFSHSNQSPLDALDPSDNLAAGRP